MKSRFLLTIFAAALVAGSAVAAETARIVRIDLPGTEHLTVAEVEVYEGKNNVARKGKATQSSIASGGDPARAIDGKSDGSYGSNTQTPYR